MVYTYKVTLEGIKGFHRVYKISGNYSLYTFHKQLRSDLEFTVDQPILFKALDAQGGVVARYALVDIGYGTVDNVKIADTVKAGITKMVYFYDVASRKSVNITLEGEEPGADTSPEIVDAKGPNPIEFENGYVAFEDRQEAEKRLAAERSARGVEESDDEDDFDDEDEDDSDGEGEDSEEEDLIYDPGE